jgi:SAM-dependent methyltransferase
MSAPAQEASNEERGTVIWQDVECGAYETDLPLWEELAEQAGGPVLEIGAGTGRVALHLARLGHEVTAIDSDPVLIEELGRRAAAENLTVRAEAVDATGFTLDQRFALILAPMQLIQLLPNRESRRHCLAAGAEHLRPGGLLALAIVDGAQSGAPPSPPLPDVRERDGWVYSSLPLGVRLEDDSLLVGRLRQAVSPDGRLRESESAVRLQILSPAALEDEARVTGLRPAGRRRIDASEAHVGSTVVLLEG